MVAQVCAWKNMKLLYCGTGCIYEYDAAHPIGGEGFREMDAPNFDFSWYSKTKQVTESILSLHPNVLTLRFRMPLTDEIGGEEAHPRNFISKIVSYARVVDVKNSMSSLPHLLPLAVRMMEQGITGVVNFTNPGTISHHEILALYKEYIDPSFEWKGMTLEEQAALLKAGRSNCALNVDKLVSFAPEVPDILTAVRELFERASRRRNNNKRKSEDQEPHPSGGEAL